MSDVRHITVKTVEDFCIATLLDNRIVDDMNIYELGQELFALVEQSGYKKIVLNFTNVGFLSSAALGKLIMLYKKVAVRNGSLKLCCISPPLINEENVLSSFANLTLKPGLTGARFCFTNRIHAKNF